MSIGDLQYTYSSAGPLNNWTGTTTGYSYGSSANFDGTNEITIGTSALEDRVRELEEQVRKGEPQMRSLFKVYIVNPKKNGTLLDEKTVIAETEEQALLKAGVAQVADTAGLDLEQVDTLVENLGVFIRPRQETQRVKVTKEDDDD